MTDSISMSTSSTAPLALVTGGSRGLGRSVALHLARSGVDVVLSYKSSRAEADKTVDEIRGLGRWAVATPLDISRTGELDAFVSTVSSEIAGRGAGTGIDILVNNAGMGVYAPFEQITEAQFDELVDVHLKGVFFLTQKLLPLLNDGGQILNVSTGLTSWVVPNYSAYAAVKGAVEVLTRYQAKELGARGIRVNAIAPGAVETDFGGGVIRDNADLNAWVASQTALGRVGLPEDIGSAVAALLSPACGWINGQRIEVSGGQLP